MADLKISELNALAGADLASGDLVAVVDSSASETKKLTVAALVENAVDLIADDSIPSAKILFADDTVTSGALVNGSVDTLQIASGAVTADKLADDSALVVQTTLPASGTFRGQLAIETGQNKVYVWSGSAWISAKAAGSINSISVSNTAPVSLTTSQADDVLTISAQISDTTAAAQFVAGPSGASGAVSLRAIVGDDLPTAATSSKGAVIVNGNGLAMSGDTITIDNSISEQTDAFHVVKYSANGLVTASQAIAGSDLPVALSNTVGVVKPGTGLSVNTDGALNHSNAVTGATGTKITFDAQGHVTSSASLEADDIPDIPATKITSESLDAALFPLNGITGTRLANYSTTVFGGAASTSGVTVFPASGEFIGQYFFEENRGDLYIWSGASWIPVTITSGELVFAGVYDASANQVKSLTAAGQAQGGFTVGSALPSPDASNVQFYFVVEDSGTGVSPAPAVALQAPDQLLSDGTSWQLLDVSTTVASNTAANTTFTAAGDLSSSTVQAAIEELDTEKLAKAGGTVTGEVEIGSGGSVLIGAGSLKFEGSTADAFETEIAVVDPTADRTITLPNVTGTVVTSGDSGTVTNTMLAGSIAYSKLSLTGSIVNGDISSSAAIAYSKLNLSGSILNADIGASAAIAKSKLNLTGAIVNADISASAAIAYSKLSLTGSIVNADIGSSAAIADSKLATISTAGKVSGAAITSGTIGGSTVLNTSGNITTSGTITDSAGSIRKIPQNAKTAAYTLVAADGGKHISITTGGITVPASVFSVGDNVTIFNNSTSNQTITQGTGVTLRSGGSTATGNRTLANYGVATILCVASDVFVITGTGIS